jgi:hypothetical protein
VGLLAAVGADEQAAFCVQAADRAFDDVALGAEPGAVLGFAPGDGVADAASAQDAAMLLGVVAAVGEDPLGRLRGRPPRAPRTAGIASKSGINCVMSLRLAAVTDQAKGKPRASVRRWCLAPGRARSTGLGPSQPPPFSPAR